MIQDELCRFLCSRLMSGLPRWWFQNHGQLIFHWYIDTYMTAIEELQRQTLAMVHHPAVRRPILFSLQQLGGRVSGCEWYSRKRSVLIFFFCMAIQLLYMLNKISLYYALLIPIKGSGEAMREVGYIVGSTKATVALKQVHTCSISFVTCEEEWGNTHTYVHTHKHTHTRSLHQQFSAV